MVIYLGKFEFFERYRASADLWPWESDPVEWQRLKWRSIRYSLFNLLVTTPCLLLPFLWCDFEIPNRTDFDFPSTLQFFLTIMFSSMMADMTGFLSHSTFHRPWLYKNIHKIHHEHTVSTSLATIDFHPIEHIFSNVIPQVIGAELLGKRMHLSCYFGFMILRMISSIEEHAGYKFSWSMFRLVPFHLDGQEHVYHHSDNVGNYASFLGIWDTVIGSNA
jgi:methylsterol monooxygenase